MNTCIDIAIFSITLFQEAVLSGFTRFLKIPVLSLLLLGAIPLAAGAAPEAERPTPMQRKAEGKKVQKVVFLQDDTQFNMVTKAFVLKHVTAADLQPFVKSAVIRYDPVSSVIPLADKQNNRQLLIVSTGHDMMPYVDEMVKVLDRPGKINQYGSSVYGTGIAYGFYVPRFRAAESMADVLTGIFIVSNDQNARFLLDSKTNTFYFKDTPFRVQLIKEKMAWLDRELPQAVIELKIYEVRDSDLKDIGIDYLAWKNGPGLNLFSAGYEALNIEVAETLIQQMTQAGIDLFGNFSCGFGGMYTAPAFDFSFIRILQQNGRATINSTAQVTVSNEPGAEFKVNFSPEYQNLLKDDRHRSSVAIGGDASLAAVFRNTVITGGKEGVVNFSYDFQGKNVVERNNMGTEISDGTQLSSSVTIGFGKERIIANWEKTSDVEQTIGIPFLSELPVLKYIFGTTTSQTETVRYFVTARAVPLNIRQPAPPGIPKDFDELIRKNGGKAKK